MGGSCGSWVSSMTPWSIYVARSAAVSMRSDVSIEGIISGFKDEKAWAVPSRGEAETCTATSLDAAACSWSPRPHPPQKHALQPWGCILENGIGCSIPSW